MIEYGDDAIVLDCGITFPDANMLGVDLVLPNFNYLREIRHKLRAFVITHGHEDHIGALPYALPEFDLPIYGSKLTLGLVGVKLEEPGLRDQADLRVVKGREIVTIGPFRCQFFNVCHSIPDAMGVAIHTPIGTIVHTGDFKIDHTPVDGVPLDIQTLGRLGDEGVLLLMSDSTYADQPGHTPSEAVIAETFDRVFNDAPGRIIVATFSSLISRVQQVVDAAYAYGRRVCFVGRSMERNVRVARDLGYLHVPDGRHGSGSSRPAGTMPPTTWPSSVRDRRGNPGRRSCGWPTAITDSSTCCPTTPSWSQRPRSRATKRP